MQLDNLYAAKQVQKNEDESKWKSFVKLRVSYTCINTIVSWDMINSPLTKLQIVELLLKVAIIGLIAFSIFELCMQFIFSYMNQSIYGPHLTVINFAGPLLITIVILFIAGFRPLSTNNLAKLHSLSIIFKTIWLILLFVLLGWQTWYVISYYKIKANLDLESRLTELLPMVTGMIATLSLVIANFRRKHTS